MNNLRLILVLFLLNCSIGYAGNLSVVVNTWPPYVGKALPGKGMAMQIVTSALHRKGHQTTITIESWTRTLEGIDVGVFDVVGAIWKTPEREKWLLFSEPYLQNNIKFIKKKSLVLNYQSLEDLTGYVIGIVKNYAYDEAFIQSQILIKIPQNHIIQNLTKLREDVIDVTLGDERAIIFELNQYMHGQVADYEFLRKPLSKQGLHIAVSRRNPAAQQIIADFNQAIAEMKADGSLEKFLAQYQAHRQNRKK
jgi:polar amino acid transport system substrate-binding protein